MFTIQEQFQASKENKKIMKAEMVREGFWTGNFEQSYKKYKHFKKYGSQETNKETGKETCQEDSKESR